MLSILADAKRLRSVIVWNSPVGHDSQLRRTGSIVPNLIHNQLKKKTVGYLPPYRKAEGGGKLKGIPIPLQQRETGH